MTEQKKTTRRRATKKETAAEAATENKKEVTVEELYNAGGLSKEARHKYRQLIAERNRLQGMINQALKLHDRIDEIDKELSGLT